MKSPANETLSRWLYQGVPLLVGIGIIAVVVLRRGFGLSLARLALPIAVVLGIQLLFYVSMYRTRQQYRRTGDLRTAALLTGAYGLSIGLAGMYYAAKLGILRVNTFTDNYVAFSIYIVVVVGIGIGLLSFSKPKRT